MPGLASTSLYPPGLSAHAQTRYPTNATVRVRTRFDGDDDAYGNPTVIWADGDEIDVWLQPRAEPLEVTDGRETVVSDFELVDPSATIDVSHVDRVVHSDGREFDVVGAAKPVVWPGGVTHRIDVNLRLVE